MNIRQLHCEFRQTASASAHNRLTRHITSFRELRGKLLTSIEKDLQSKESIEYRGAIHWAIYLRPVLLASLGYAGVTGIPGNRYNLADSWVTALSLGLLELAFFWGMLGFLAACFTEWSTEIAVTDRRVILKRGFIHRRSIEIDLDKVEIVDVTQTAVGRFLNYGDIVLAGTEAGVAPLQIHGVSAPLKLRDRIVVRRSLKWHFSSGCHGLPLPGTGSILAD